MTPYHKKYIYKVKYVNIHNVKNINANNSANTLLVCAYITLMESNKNPSN